MITTRTAALGLITLAVSGAVAVAGVAAASPGRKAPVPGARYTYQVPQSNLVTYPGDPSPAPSRTVTMPPESASPIPAPRTETASAIPRPRR
jgi:hypothetical protein